METVEISTGYQFNVGEIYVLSRTSYIGGILFGRVVGFTPSNNPRFEILAIATSILKSEILDVTYQVTPGTAGDEIKPARLAKDGNTKSWYITLDHVRYRVKELYSPTKKYQYTHYH